MGMTNATPTSAVITQSAWVSIRTERLLIKDLVEHYSLSKASVYSALGSAEGSASDVLLQI